MKQKINNPKVLFIVAVVGAIFCGVSFVLAIINQSVGGSILFLLAFLYCLNSIISPRYKKNNNRCEQALKK